MAWMSDLRQSSAALPPLLNLLRKLQKCRPLAYLVAAVKGWFFWDFGGENTHDLVYLHVSCSEYLAVQHITDRGSANALSGGRTGS
jgi:hypothetical protein